MRLVIPGPPISKKRPRSSHMHGVFRTYDSQKKILNAERQKILNLLDSLNLSPNDFKALWRLPLKVDIAFHVSIADSSTEAERRAKLWNLEYSHFDVDNLSKWTLDLLNDLLWKDDRQIVKLTAEKKYSQNPCTIIEINTIEIPMDKKSQAIVKLFSPNEMSELYHDAALMANAIAEMKAAFDDDQLLFLPKISEKIIDFSKKYSKKLVKLAKE